MKIAVLASHDASLINFRGDLLRTFVATGQEVVAVAPLETPAVPEALARIGVKFRTVGLVRAGMNVFVDWRYLRELKAVLRDEKPDVVLAYTIKPVVYGMRAASTLRIAGRYALITGLGAAFHSGGVKGWVLRRLAMMLYRTSLARCTRIIVQNAEIGDYFRKRRIVARGADMITVPGSGVNLVHFVAEPIFPEVTRFLFLGRLLWDKGVGEFSAAARAVKQSHPSAEFWIVGRADPNPAAMTPEEMRQLQQEGIVRYFDQVDDVRPLLRQCSALVLPSYHEGMPRSVLEAMATGRPVITTDTIGCRETIFDAGAKTIGAHGVRAGVNGLLVPVRSAAAVAEAMLYLVKQPETAREMGRAGRRLAEKHFDVEQINRRMLEAMDLNPPLPCSSSP